MECKEKMEAMWRDLRQRIFAAAIGLTGNRHEAEDLAQEACLKIHLGMEGFRGESQFFTWAYSVLANQYRDQCRLAKRKLELSLTRARDAAKSLDFSDLVVARTLVDKLPRLQKKVFLLKEYYGYSYQEIAKLTQSSLESVRARLYRARKQLAQWSKQ